MTVTVKKIGGSVAVLIPKSVARELDLSTGTEMELAMRDDGIMLTPRKRERRPLKDLLKGVDAASYKRQRAAIGADGPVGKEIW